MAQVLTCNEQPQSQRLLAELARLQLVEKRDFWLMHNGSHWRLRWFDHTTTKQQAQGDALVNALLNGGQ